MRIICKKLRNRLLKIQSKTNPASNTFPQSTQQETATIRTSAADLHELENARPILLIGTVCYVTRVIENEPKRYFNLDLLDMMYEGRCLVMVIT